jgi:hypothetical protein
MNQPNAKSIMKKSNIKKVAAMFLLILDNISWDAYNTKSATQTNNIKINNIMAVLKNLYLSFILD